jgi:hypothetical protein
MEAVQIAHGTFGPAALTGAEHRLCGRVQDQFIRNQSDRFEHLARRAAAAWL